MFVFSTVGIPVISLFLSFFHPQVIQARSVSRIENRRTVYTIVRPTTPSVPTSPTFFQQTQVTPTTLPTNIPTPIITQDTFSSTSSPQADDKKTFIMNAINDYRASQGLSAVQINDTTCSFAKIRAQEITTNFNHDGFNQRIQNHILPYPNYSLVTENIAETSNYQDVVNMWRNSPGHAANMRADTPYVCIESYGNYFAYEGWRGAK